jgi:hypothetical protein
LAADAKINYVLIIDRQRKNVENIPVSDDSTIGLESKTDHQLHIEETNSINTFGRVFKIFYLFSFGSFLEKRYLKRPILNINEHKQTIEAIEYDM